MIDTNQTRGGGLAGTLPIHQRDLPHFNSSRMDMISACLRKSDVLIDLSNAKEKMEPNTTTERLKQKY